MRPADLRIIIDQSQPWSREHGLHIRTDENFIAEPLTFSKPPDGQYTPPCFNLSNDSCQSLMDALWQAGFKPSEGTGSAGSLKATQDHLKDMRRLVFEEKE